MSVHFRQRIAYCQARNTFLVAFCLGSALSVIPIGYDLVKERRNMDATVAALTGMLRESAVQAVYQVDHALAERVVNGLFEYQPICRARITDEFGVVIAHKERAFVGRFQWLVTPILGKEKSYVVPLLYDPQRLKKRLGNPPQAVTAPRVVGLLNISVDSYLFAANFFSRARVLILSDLIQNIVLVSGLTLIFYFSLTQPLLSMMKQVSAIDIAQPAQKLLAFARGHAKDELSLLVQTVNRVLEGFGDILAKHRTAQEELRKHRDHLEELVNARTVEIELQKDQLRQEKEKVQRYLDVAGVILLVIGADQRVALINKKGCAVLGYPEQEILGQNWFECFLPERERANVLNLFARLIAGDVEMMAYSENAVVTRNGEERIIAWHDVLLRDPAGRPSATLSSGEDITERKRAEEALRESEERYRILFESAADSIVVIEQETGKHLQFNRQTYEHLGYTAEEFAQLRAYAVDTITPEQNLLIVQQFQQFGHLQFETQHRSKTGELRDMLININAIMYQGKMAALGIGRDITDRKQAEVELQRAKAAAEAANRVKSQFIANMSHELRTPLNAILGFAQMMARNPNLSANDQDHLGVIQRSGEHLLALINQVLDLSKIEAGQITLNEKNFDLICLLNDLKEMFLLRAQHKGLSLLFNRADDVPRYVRADELKLRQVLINLLNNAVKFTPEGGVTLDCRLLIDDWRLPQSTIINHQSTIQSQSSIVNLQFSIADTGSGIAPDEIAHLFEAFVQTRTGREAQEGTGLGLAISRKFVQLMGGDLTVKSEVGRGTTFLFEIPVSVVETADALKFRPTRRAVALESRQPRYRLLIVDDQPDNCQLLVKLLNPFGFELRDAVNGQDAFAIWTTWQPHLIWMDLRMPVMDGYEATKRIRQEEFGLRNAEFAGTPNAKHQTRTVIIAVTAGSFEEERADVLSTGCDDFLRKPFRDAEIFDLLHKHLGVRFVYEEQAQPATAKETCQAALTPDALAVLPVELRTCLQQAVERLDLTMTNTVIAEIRQYNQPLADVLAELLQQFRFDALQTLCEKSTT